MIRKLFDLFRREKRDEPKAHEYSVPTRRRATGRFSAVLPLPGPMKRAMPQSYFTRSGPGVLESLKQDLREMSDRHRAVMRAKGWDRGLLP